MQGINITHQQSGGVHYGTLSFPDENAPGGRRDCNWTYCENDDPKYSFDTHENIPLEAYQLLQMMIKNRS